MDWLAENIFGRGWSQDQKGLKSEQRVRKLKKDTSIYF